MGRSGVGAALVDLPEDHTSRREIEVHTAILLRYERAEVASPGHRRDELLRVAAFCVQTTPVLVREAGAYLPDAPAQVLVDHAPWSSGSVVRRTFGA